MKVYLAAPYGSRDFIRTLVRDLDDYGFVVTSSWLAETHEINAGSQGAAVALSDAQVATHALDDLVDVQAADVLVLFTAASVGVEGGGGRHVETGYAIASGKPVVVVGQPENVFHRLGRPRVRLTADWSAALTELLAMAKRLPVGGVDPWGLAANA